MKQVLQVVYHRTLNLNPIILLICCGFTANLYAQGADQSEDRRLQSLFSLSLEELLAIPVNSASLMPDKAQLSASSIFVVSRESWQSRNAKRIADAVESAPGVAVLPFRFGADAIAVRGFAGSNLPRGLSVRWDGVPLTAYSNGAAVVSVPNIDVNILDNIEIVRGPASALYGSDAFHGVLSLYSLNQPGNFIQAALGDEKRYDLSAYFDLPSPQSTRTTLALATSGQGDQNIAYLYTDPLTGNDNSGHRHNQFESQTAAINFNTTETAPVDFRWGLYWNQFDGDRFIGPGRSQTPGVSALADQDWSGSETDFLMTNAAVTFYLPANISTEVNGFFWNADVMQETKVPRMGGIGENHVTVGDQRYGVGIIVRQNQTAFNTQWALSVRHDMMAVDQGQTTVVAPNNTVLAQVDEGFANRERHINSVTLEVKTNFAQDKWKLVYGGRIDDYSDFGTQKTPRVGLIYAPTRDWTYKLLYGRAFRAPTAFETYGIGNFKGNPDLDSEIIDTLEWAAFKYADNWTAGITFFASRWRDGIIRVPSQDPNFNLEFLNVDENRSRGIETQYQYHQRQWSAEVSVSHARSENKTQDEEYGAFPQTILNAALNYRTKSGLHVTLNNRLHWNATSGIDDEFDNNTKLSTYWRVDLSLRKDINPQLQLNAGVRNLLNRDNFLPSLFNAESGVPEEDLSITAGLLYSFR
jgi:iron complex outermembrane receptor protein